MMTTRDEFEHDLPALLGQQGPGTVAVLSDGLAAYWNGRALIYTLLCERRSGAVAKESSLDGYLWEEWQPTLEAWLAKPVFKFRPEVFQWLVDAPPLDAGQ